MKPRLRLRRGVWVCSLMDGRYARPPLGHGYTPMEALAEWRHLFALAGGIA
jgi:hypothetical protein